MSTDRLQRAFPIAGVLFALVLAGGLALTNGEPDSGASRVRVFDYWSGHYGRELISSLILIPFAIVFLLLLTAELRRVLRSSEADEAIYSPLALAGGILVAAGLGVTGSLGAAVATAAHHHDANATYTLVQLQSYDWVPWMVGFAVLLLASGVGGLRTRALPKFLAIPALVLGIACLTPLGFFALFAIPVWTAAAGIVLYRAQRGAARARLGRAATGVAMLLALVLLGTTFAATASGSRKASPGLIAFTRYRLQDNPIWSEIWVASPDGSHAVKVSHSPKAVEDDGAHFSPDGRWIVFDRCPKGPCTIWLVRPDGSDQHRISPPCATPRTPAVCPNDDGASFAPDGRHIVFTDSWGGVKKTTLGDEIKHSGIATIGLDGKHLTILRQLAPYVGDLQSARISPNGKLIVFDRYNSPSARPAGGDALFVVGINGGTPRQITPWRLNAGSPAWSPDGSKILFKQFIKGVGELNPGTNLYNVGVDGSGLTRITNVGPYHYVLAGSFSPDGASIVYATDENATLNPRGNTFADIFTMRLGETAATPVTRTANLDGWPTWGVGQ